MPTKTELFEELKRLSMQIESVQAQEANSFGVERGEHKKTLSYLWERVDILLDQYNFNKKFKNQERCI